MEYIPAKSIVSRCKAPGKWFGIDYNMNLYRGCCHGCIYCDSRSDCYRIEEFDRVCAKKDALRIVRDELRRKTRTGVVGTGAMSDPYNPFEKQELLTRHALELIEAFGFGAAIATKSVLLERDIDILQSVAEQAPVLLKITITTSEDELAKKIEPHVPVSSRRFEMIRKLSDAGLFSGVLLMPVLPFLEDSKENVLDIVKRTAAVGGKFIYPAFGVTLRGNQRAYYLDKLDSLFPGQGLSDAYKKQFGYSYECRSPKAGKLWDCFADACEKEGICYQMQDIIHAYKKRYRAVQLSLFDEWPGE